MVLDKFGLSAYRLPVVAVLNFLSVLPAGGNLRFADANTARALEWFDPRSGATTPATAKAGVYTPPEAGAADRPHDWVLVSKTR